MAKEIAGWEVVSGQVNRRSIWETLFGAFVALPLPSTITYTVREKSTGTTRTVTCFSAGELPERIAKGQFDFDRILSEADSEMVLSGIRAGGGARALAFEHLELVFRQRQQKGDIEPGELFTSLQAFARRAGEDAVREFSNRCFPLLPEATQAEIKDLQRLDRRRGRRR